MTGTALRAATATLVAGVLCLGALAVLPAAVALVASTTVAVALVHLPVPLRSHAVRRTVAN